MQTRGCDGPMRIRQRCGCTPKVAHMEVMTLQAFETAHVEWQQHDAPFQVLYPAVQPPETAGGGWDPRFGRGFRADFQPPLFGRTPGARGIDNTRRPVLL